MTSSRLDKLRYVGLKCPACYRCRKLEDGVADLYSERRMSVGELLDMSSPPIIVPEWQRNFSWGKTEVECLWLDMLASADHQSPRGKCLSEHSLGSIRLAQHNGTQVLLDGQNRLATVTILLSVIRDFVAQYRGHEAVRIQKQYIRDFRPATGTASYKLTLNRFDQAFFQREIQETPLAGRQTPQPQIHSHRHIWQARNVLADRLKQRCGGSCSNRVILEKALGIETILTRHTQVAASLSEWSDRMRLPVNHPD